MPLILHVVLMLVLAVVLAGGIGWYLLERPNPITNASRMNTPEKLETMAITLFVVVIIGGVAALTVACRKQWVSEAASRRAEIQAFTDRFSSASKLMGSDRAAIRLSGIYAMAALADDWALGRQSCIDVLCAYLRMPYQPPRTTADGIDLSAGEWSDVHRHHIAERQVRWTVIRVIALHLRPDSPVCWAGADFDLSGAVLDGGNFSGIVLNRGNLNFNHATFVEGVTSFSAAEFRGGEVSFVGAHFRAGVVDFSGVRFSSGRANFNWAHFDGGHLDFTSAVFSGTEVTFHEATFAGAELALTNPAGYRIPPKFDEWIEGPPKGLLLPAI